MKKAVAVLAVLMVLSGALFAAEGRIGLSVSPAWKWYTGSSVNTGTTSIALMAEGANYFGDEGGLRRKRVCFTVGVFFIRMY